MVRMFFGKEKKVHEAQVSRKLLKDYLRSERIPLGVNKNDLKRKIVQKCRDLGVPPEDLGKLLLPLVAELASETVGVFDEVSKGQ